MSPVGWKEQGGHDIQDEGVDVPDRKDLNFAGTGVTVTDVSGKTKVNIPGGMAVLGDHDHTGDPGDGGDLTAYADAVHAHALGDHDHTGDPGDGGVVPYSPTGHDHDAEYYTEAEVDDLIAAISVAPSGSFLVEGGQVVWETGLQFRVSAARYYIAGTLYESLEQTITLDAADPGDDRIDVIALDTTETVVKITGTPGASASRPDVDPFTQLHLTFVLIPAGSTTPGDVASDILYQENLGAPTEWAVTDSGANIDPNSLNNPRSGTKDIEFTTAASTDWVNFAAASAFNLANYDQFVVNIRNKAAWAAQKSLRLSFRSGGVVVGSYLSIDDGLYGFSHSLTGAYQQVSIPVSAFAVPVSQLVDSFRIEVRGAGGTLGLYLDDIMLQGGVPQEAIGISQEEADARYRKLEDDIVSFDLVFDGGGSVIAVDARIALRFYSNYRLLAWSLGAANESGSIVIGMWKDTHANFPPTIADTMTNGNDPEISAAQAAEDTDLSDWTTVEIAAGEWIIFNPDSVTDLTMATLALKLLRL